MKRVPRILPLVAVAIGGVIAANALSGVRGGAGFLSPGPAAAEEAPAKPSRDGKARPAAKTPAPPVDPKAQVSSAPTSVHTTPAPVCAPSAGEIAKAAGLSPAELAMLQNLQNRRGQIETRERDLDTEVQLLSAAQSKLDGKLKALNTLKGEIQALMGQVDQKTQAEIDRLVVVYTKMKPGEAAAVMAQLDDKVRLPIAAAMKAAGLSAILGKMGTLEAKVLTERLAHRFQPIQVALETPSPQPRATSEDGDKSASPTKPKTVAAAHPRPRRRPARVQAAASASAAAPVAAKAEVKSVQPSAPAAPVKAPV